MHCLGCGKGTDALANLHDEFLAQRIRCLIALFESHERIDSLSSKLIGYAYYGSLSN